MPYRRGSKRSQSESDAIDKVKTHFQDIMKDPKYDWIDPYSCIPFTTTRPISKSGVRRLVDIFDGSFGDESIVGGGIACGTDTPIVVRLSGSHLTHVLQYFRTKGLSESEAKERVKERSVWHGIIDGEHSFHAITHLMETKNDGRVIDGSSLLLRKVSVLTGTDN